ncbi:MAG: hypothetical protein H7X89_12765, partial [Rhizobiales bacterium]|nr:hypothetical protein [Hyphomicrobiales bacterium]
MPEDIDGLRQATQASRPDYVLSALAGYERFTADEPPPDAKGFAAWHAAAKAALTHVDVLVKLVRWAGAGANAEADSDDGISQLLAEARQALDQ